MYLFGALAKLMHPTYARFIFSVCTSEFKREVKRRFVVKLNISMAEIEGIENFEKFSKYVGSNSQEGGYFVGAGRYLLLHFDLHRPQNDTPKKGSYLQRN
ncbi:hypothetical protein BGP_0995 [Beggiatoa sp. PS]|nr:hypothetical protein BGP_0995 [Beggiatoa sp. PS]